MSRADEVRSVQVEPTQEFVVRDLGDLIYLAGFGSGGWTHVVFPADEREHPCCVYWGSHGCKLEHGHEGPHVCSCCDCGDHERDHDAEGCVAAPPYYGPETSFYGEDA